MGIYLIACRFFFKISLAEQITIMELVPLESRGSQRNHGNPLHGGKVTLTTASLGAGGVICSLQPPPAQNAGSMLRRWSQHLWALKMCDLGIKSPAHHPGSDSGSDAFTALQWRGWLPEIERPRPAHHTDCPRISQAVHTGSDGLQTVC